MLTSLGLCKPSLSSSKAPEGKAIHLYFLNLSFFRHWPTSSDFLCSELDLNSSEASELGDMVSTVGARKN